MNFSIEHGNDTTIWLAMEVKSDLFTGIVLYSMPSVDYYDHEQITDELLKAHVQKQGDGHYFVIINTTRYSDAVLRVMMSQTKLNIPLALAGCSNMPQAELANVIENKLVAQILDNKKLEIGVIDDIVEIVDVLEKAKFFTLLEYGDNSFFVGN